MRKYFKQSNMKMRYYILLVVILLTSFNFLFSAEVKWLKVGNIHNFYQSYGSEPEEGFGVEQQWGLRWPAFYPHQDIQAARGFWIGVEKFDDPVAGKEYPYKVVHCGPRPRSEIEENEMMPVEFKMYGRFDHPSVYVDNATSSDLTYDDKVDSVDANMKADRYIYSKFRTSTGITVTRKIYYFSQQNYDNFFIYDYTFENTGICNKDATITHNNTLNGVYFHWQQRNAIAGEGTTQGTSSAEAAWTGYKGWGMPNDTRWGINTLNDALGENQNAPNTTKLYPNANISVDQLDKNSDYMRCVYSWHGKHPEIDYDNIGSPNYLGYNPDGKLGASQFTGTLVIHADTSPSDHADNKNQPSTTLYIESNDAVTMANDQYSEDKMKNEYTNFIAYGHPEKSHAEKIGDGTPPTGGGGQSSAFGIGPYTMAIGDKINVVLAEAVNGLSNEQDIEIGGNWFKTKKGTASPSLVLPNGSTTNNADDYKDTWVYTGFDSLMKTFKRAINLYDNNFNIALPPPPPNSFLVESQGNRIKLEWASNAEESTNFMGYKVYRALGRKDSNYYEIFDCNLNDNNLTHEYFDYTAERGQKYFYYIISYDDGTTNNINPGTPLRSSLFYTKTNIGATLKRPPSKTLDDIRIVPNPYNFKNMSVQFVNVHKIMFYNMPAACKIKIFTERGDLIYSYNHSGSGDASWNLLTSSRQIISSGIYIAYFEIPEDIYDPSTGDLLVKKGVSTYKKFIVIR